jgi:hypothetical protein
MMTTTNRHFSKKNGDSDYEKDFASFLDKSKDKSGPTLDEQLKERELKSAEEQARVEKEKAEFEKRKQEEFEDMLGGKKRKEDMNLQELFKTYYHKVKEQDPKEYVNSAKSSLNSFSSLLEKRRQSAAKKEEKKATEEPAS